MGMFLLLMIIAVAVFVGIASKKFYGKPYIVNFAIAALMLLLVVQTIQMQPISMFGYVAIVCCSLAFFFQIALGFKNAKVSS